MATNRTVNGVTYVIPDQGDNFSWGTGLSGWVGAVTNGALYKSGGVFTLTADADFGANFGLKSLYFKSRSAAIANSGVVQLGNADAIVFAGGSGGVDVGLSVDSSNYIKSNTGFDAGSAKIVSVATPTATTDAATKGYVDGITGANATAAGSNTNIQYNNGGLLGGSGNFLYNVGNNTVVVTGFLNVGNTVSLVGDLGAARSVLLHNQNTSDGRCIATFIQDRGVTQQYDVGIDPNGGNLKLFGIRDMTQAGNPIRVALSNTGNVGIGTTAPAHALDVVGLIQANNLIVGGNSVANAHRDIYSNVGVLTGNTNINCAACVYQDVMLAGSINVFFQNVAATGIATTLTLYVRQSANGGNTITWQNTIRWSDNNTPVLSSTKNTADMFTFTTFDGGTVWLGIQVMGNVPLANTWF